MKTIFAWQAAPVLRPLVGWCLGIVIADTAHPSTKLLLIAIMITCLGLTSYAYLQPSTQYRSSHAVGILIHILFISSGALAVNTRAAITIPFGKPGSQLLIILERPEPKGAGCRTFASVYDRGSGRYVKQVGRVQVYFPLKDTSLAPGSTLATRNMIQPIHSTGNPGTFNYEQYCRVHGIRGQLFLKSSEYVQLHSSAPLNLHFAVLQARTWLLKRLSKWMPASKEKGLAEALLIGYKTDLDPQLVQSYMNTGVVHVIAISGLHIGLIYAILMLLTAPLMRKKQTTIRLIVVLVPLWFFCLVAGGEPSVLRSAVMFTFVALSGVSKRGTSVYQSLAISAFILLIINPLWIYDTGFLLSYSAVLSILLFQPIFSNLYQPAHPLISMVWQLMAVTFAAQVLTLPVCIYLFHKIPLLFLFTNLVAVPLSSGILMMLLLLTALSDFPFVATIISDACLFALRLMNHYIIRMDRLPLTSWDHLSINTSQAILLLTFILFIYGFIQYRKKNWLLPASIAMLVFFMLRSSSFIHAENQSEFIVYNLQKNLVSEVVYGRRSLVIAAPKNWDTNLQIANALDAAATLYRIQTRKLSTNPFVEFLGHRILIVDSSFINAAPDSCFISYAIIANNRQSPEKILDPLHIGCIILTPTLSRQRLERWERYCEKKGITCHNILKNGAFAVHLQPLPLSPCRITNK